MPQKPKKPFGFRSPVLGGDFLSRLWQSQLAVLVQMEATLGDEYATEAHGQQRRIRVSALPKPIKVLGLLGPGSLGVCLGEMNSFRKTFSKTRGSPFLKASASPPHLCLAISVSQLHLPSPSFCSMDLSAIEHPTFSALTRPLCDLYSLIPPLLVATDKKLRVHEHWKNNPGPYGAKPVVSVVLQASSALQRHEGTYGALGLFGCGLNWVYWA
ncbi:hypothetical protein Gotur_013564 [Gossypium turneri]